jgi:site-specific recombinase XerD
MEAVNIYAMVATWKENKKGVPVYISVDINNKRAGLKKTGIRVSRDDWDAGSKMVRDKVPNSNFLNAMIKNTENELRTVIIKRQAINLPITPQLIKQFIKANGKELDFTLFAESTLLNSKEKAYGDDTKRRYMDEINRLREFQESISFADINTQFLEDYRFWLQNTYKKKDGHKLHKNSIWKALGFVRTVFNFAVKQQVIIPAGDPFKVFTVGSYEADEDKIKFIEMDQLDLLEKTLVEKRNILERMTIMVGWRFLTMCVFGMRISDAMRLSNEFINDAGELDFTPHKTRRYGNKANIPISTERQRRYLEITLQHKFPEVDPKSFRNTFNDHLKLLAAHAGISVHLTSHVGRHTMGGFMVDADIKEKAGMAMLGLKSSDVFKNYSHLKQKKLHSEANKLKNIF